MIGLKFASSSKESGRDGQISGWDGDLGAKNGSLSSWLNSTIPNAHLPLETLDYIVDHLHDEPKILEECYLISKSWIPRTRKHLFAEIKFRSVEDVDLWKTTFPDPSNFPVCHTHTLSIC